MTNHHNERIDPTPHRAIRTGAIALAVAGVLGVPFAASAATVTWDGSGDPNAGGTWETETNWDTDALPGTGDNATLGDVTTGTRTVTLTAPQTINRLTLTQTTAGAVNTLTLNENLTLNGSGTYIPFVYTPTAGVGSIVTNLLAGKTLTVATSGNDVAANFNGTLNMLTGSTLVIRTTDRNGGYSFNNSGIANMDAAAIQLDYATTEANNNPGAGLLRTFTNSGTWAISNHSSVAYTSTTGKSQSGYQVGRYNTNSGTMSVASGSSVEFLTLSNVGTMNLGSSTGGVSDATVHLGSPDDSFALSRLVNGLTQDGTTTAAGTGIINFNGNVVLGVPGGKNNTYSELINGGTQAITAGATVTDFSTGSTINVGDGVTPMTLTLPNHRVLVHNAVGNAFNLNANATLALVPANNNGASANVQNNGTFTHAGALQLFKFGSGTNKVITSSTGVYAIKGVAATIEFQAGSTANELAVSGRLTGSGTNDMLTFLTNSAPVNLTDAEVTPGDGNGAVGTLSLVNTDVTFGGSSNLLIDLIGDSTDLLAITGNLNLDSLTDQLTVTATGSQSLTRYVIVSYSGSLSGVFDSVSLNGLGSGASIDYSVANEIAVIVPEPASLALLGMGALGLLRRRRMN